MSEYAPPAGPPPPKVPEGWKAVWNDQYKEWFFVNLHTKQSTWEKPTEPAPKPGDAANDGLPAYDAGQNAPQVGDTKKPLDSNNPYNQGNGSKGSGGETDEEMARRLQAEFNGQNQGTAAAATAAAGDSARGHSDSYYSSQQPQQQPAAGYAGGPNTQQDRSSSSAAGGFLNKLKSKLGSGSSRPVQQGYGGYPQQGYGGYPQQPGMYGGYPQQGYGYAQQPMYGQRPPRRGMGAGGAAALGVGGGLVGGMLLADALDDNDYADGYQDGMDAGGGDFDGGDMGGGDF